MKVILLEELRGRGGEGDVVDVAQGYAENCLLPKHLAVPATPGNLKQLEERRHNIAKREEKRVSDAQAMKAALNEKVLNIAVKVGDEGQLFGSVTSTMVAEAAKEQLGVELDRRRIELNRAIKTAGRHQVVVELYRDINATLELMVGSDMPVVAEEPAPAEEASEEAAEAEETAVSEEPSAE